MFGGEKFKIFLVLSALMLLFCATGCEAESFEELNAATSAQEGSERSEGSEGSENRDAAIAHSHDHGHGGGHHDAEPPLWTVFPFILLLLCIAILPLIPATEHWWHHNSSKFTVAMVLAVPVIFWVFQNHHQSHLGHHLVEYCQFIILLGSLFYVSGGIVLKGDIAATPKANATFIGVGALLASFMGTTGASMLLIRPLLKTNAERKHVVHTVVFFIFLVSNIGGCLTPLGDPPLFLGYLRGVEFTWTFGLWKPWLFANVVLLIVYYLWDCKKYAQETGLKKKSGQGESLRMEGGINFVFLIGIILAVAFSTTLQDTLNPMLGYPTVAEAKEMAHPNAIFNAGSPWRELCMILMMFLSRQASKVEWRKENKFTFFPIVEVAALFIGIFICMIPAIMTLRANAETLAEHISTAAHYFWVTGILSSFLDNAPTYVVFFELAQPDWHTEAGNLILMGISLGAVFMGANTYIGNGPNFMVKAIAEETGVKMPSFFGYMGYSFLILIPVFVVAVFIFLL